MERLGIFFCAEERKTYFKLSKKTAIPNTKRKGSRKKTVYSILHM